MTYYEMTYMKSKNVVLNLVVLSSISLIITIATYFANIWILSSSKYLSPTDAFFLEGMIFLLSGLLLLLGRGGINLWSQKAAIYSALAEALYHGDVVGPDGILRKDRWQPEGFTRLALILIITGIFMIVVYFLTL
jgi:hypothetical protein